MKVVQCWDDGNYTDIQLTELLRKYGAKATFNLNPGRMDHNTYLPSWTPYDAHATWGCKGFCPGAISLDDVMKVYDGFELASHCWKHETATWVPDDVFVKAAVDAKKFIEDNWQRECLGFAWPCRKYTLELADRLAEAGFAYGRICEECTDPAKYDNPMLLKPNCHFQDREFYEKYAKAKADGCEFFYFWGHTFEMMDYDKLWEQLEYKIRMISEDPDAEWANVIDIVKKK